MTYQEMLAKAATLTQKDDCLALLEETTYLKSEEMVSFCEALTASPYFAEVSPDVLNRIYKKITQNNYFAPTKKVDVVETVYDRSGAVYVPELGELLSFNAQIGSNVGDPMLPSLAFFEKIIDNKPTPEQFADIYQKIDEVLEHHPYWTELQQESVLHLLDKLSQNVPEGMAADYTEMAAWAGAGCLYSEALPYVTRGIQMSGNNEGSYEAVCDYVCEMVQKRRADPTDFLTFCERWQRKAIGFRKRHSVKREVSKTVKRRLKICGSVCKPGRMHMNCTIMRCLSQKCSANRILSMTTMSFQ